MNSSRIFATAIVFAGALLGGCTGGKTPASDPLPSLSPQPSATSTITLRSRIQALPLPCSAGFTGSMYVPNATIGAGTNVTVFAGTAPPIGTPSIQGSTTANQFASLFYVTMTPSAEVQLGSAPGFTLTLPSAVLTSGYKFYVGYFDPASAINAYQTSFEGPAIVDGQTVAFAPAIGSISMQPAVTYSFSIYEVPIPSPSPSSTP